jgi:murein DD-endopeptidase MepM/ murein hydrolase activator NlpD
MVLLKLYLETISLLKSLFLIITFPLYLLGFSINSLRKKIWISILSIGFIQRLWCPRLGTNLFSRLGRVLLSNYNFNMMIGGSLAGIAILFFLYQPEIHKFDGQYYVIFQQQGVPVANAQEASPSATASASAAVLPSSMPIVTNITATPPPSPVARISSYSATIKPQTLPASFVPPDIANTGVYYSPLHVPRCNGTVKQDCIFLSTFYRSGHPAIDMAMPTGTPIYAAADGYVSSVGSSIWAYGNVVYVNHGSNVESLYAHMSRVDVKVGQRVNKDVVIGAVGSTGHSTGPHVHFELHKNGAPFNPFTVLQWF